MTFSLVVGDFYQQVQNDKEMVDTFGDKLQVLAHQVISMKPS